MELARGNVDRQGQRRQAGVDPGAALAAGFLQYPVAQRDDEVALFGQGNEIARRHQALFRIKPAYQCFGADNAPTLGIDLGLEVQAQFLVADGTS